jgi:membrane-bound metal-dependent hydrolase YbcI (DUF457 family)
MFLGHFAAGMVGSRIEPRLRLGTAFVAAQLPDLLWPVFLLAGIERATIAPGDTAVTPLRFDHYPWSHSLVMVAAWGVALAAGQRLRGQSTRVGLIAAVLALSHWLLDFVSHRQDMPLVPWGGPRLGLGLWNSVPWTVAVEVLLFAAAALYYARGHTKGKGFALLLVTLLALYLGNLFGPPPPNMTAVALSALLLFPLLWFWGNKLPAGR